MHCVPKNDLGILDPKILIIVKGHNPMLFSLLKLKKKYICLVLTVQKVRLKNLRPSMAVEWKVMNTDQNWFCLHIWIVRNQMR